MSLKFTIVCGNCHHRLTYKTSEKEYRQLVGTLSLEIQCPQPGCHSSIDLRMVDGGNIVPVVSKSRKSTDTTGLEAVFKSPDVEKNQPFEVFGSSESVGFSPIPVEYPEFSPISRGNPTNVETPPFPPTVSVAGNLPDGLWNKFYYKFSRLPPVIQYAILLAMFAVAILILAVPTGPDKKKKQTDPPENSSMPSFGKSMPLGEQLHHNLVLAAPIKSVG